MTNKFNLMPAQDEMFSAHDFMQLKQEAMRQGITLSARSRVMNSAASSSLPAIIDILGSFAPFAQSVFLIWVGHWLSSKNGRKVKIEVDGVEITATSVKELEAMAQQVKESSLSEGRP
ncbi:hypothetical protein ACQU0X_25735 [Pseudovibrio ascidiaceicola]|uniref:hypothetical protein n=1 Tax=Pseudovibrio ascidiaceicola TaxID=285279 RepID=UPI003D364A3A